MGIGQDKHGMLSLRKTKMTRLQVCRRKDVSPYNKHSITGAVPRWLLLITFIATNAYVMRPNVKAEMRVPATANTEIVPKFRKKSRFLSVNPAAKTIGGSKP